MHHTIFDTPAVNPLLRAGSVAFLRLTGWRVEGALSAGVAKCVLIAAPHTSNWDLPYRRNKTAIAGAGSHSVSGDSGNVSKLNF